MRRKGRKVSWFGSGMSPKGSCVESIVPTCWCHWELEEELLVSRVWLEEVVTGVCPRR